MVVTLVVIVSYSAYRLTFPRKDERRNVLLVTLDTLRADRLGCYGYSEASTPNLDRLASEGVRFATAIAQVPLTLPSHTSLFTGTYPMTHGVRDNGGYTLGPELTTLAEIAKNEGYQTAAFVSAFVLDSKWGLDRGFDTYYDQFDLSRYERISLASVERIAEETVEELIPWLESVEGAPFFAWVHLFDPHAPYNAPEPFGSNFRERPYDGEVAYVDAAVGRIRRFLADHRLDESTVVVVAGDHGEGLGEHGELAHGNFVYDSTLRVPLLMRFPDRRYAGLVVKEQVALMDLFPTLAEILGAPVPDQSQAESLLPLLTGVSRPDRRLLAESFYPRLHYGWSEVLAVRSNRFKFIDTPRAELYDIGRDRSEQANLADELPEVVREMRAALDEKTASGAGLLHAPSMLDPGTERRLRALGYMAAAVPSLDVQRHQLPDPKDKIELIHAISRADALGAQGKYEEAMALLRRVLEEDPTIVDAHVSLGNKFSSAGRYEEAAAAFERAVELNPDYSLARTNLALAYKQLRRFDDAEVEFQRVLSQDPDNRQALFNLGEIHLFRKEYDQALENFRKGLELEPESPLFLRQSGIAYYYQGELEKAERRLRDAAAARHDLGSVHYVLALVYEKQGRLNEAEAEYIEERRLDPGHLESTFNLSRLYERQGRLEERIQVLEALVQSHPEWATGHIQLAKAYRDTRRPDLYPRALEEVDRGLALRPDPEQAPLAYFIRAEILDLAGRKEEARRAFEEGRALAAHKP
jgi:arylsulfatase A-like enzyme/Tfp pilus assembly protein PilF